MRRRGHRSCRDSCERPAVLVRHRKCYPCYPFAAVKRKGDFLSRGSCSLKSIQAVGL